MRTQDMPKEAAKVAVAKELLIAMVERHADDRAPTELDDWKTAFRCAWEYLEEGRSVVNKALAILISKIQETKPMNDLEKYIADKKLNETKTMNALQEYGVISDRAVWARDVHPDDWQMAIAWLVENY